MTEIWFTADTHFGHRNMLLFRTQFGVDPLEDDPGLVSEALEAHDEWLVEQWNTRVAPKDEVWLLGDFSFSSNSRTETIFRWLHGRKHLIVGNHDAGKVTKLHWQRVEKLHTFKTGGENFELCHYPMLTWRNAHKGAFHLHGHSHGNLQAPASTRLDVGVDTRPDLAPYNLEELRAILAGRTYLVADHHGEQVNTPD